MSDPTNEMGEGRLTALLERSGERIEVGEAPLTDLRQAAARSRRRRGVTVVVAAAASVAAVVGVAVLIGPEPATPRVVAPPPEPASTPAPGMRFVGLGHVAIEVPVEWSTNDTRCGVPQSDTVVIDPPRFEQTCRTTRPDDASSVEVAVGRPIGVADFERVEIDGAQALRGRTGCNMSFDGGGCGATLWIPSESVYFRASAQESAEVDRLLDSVRVLSDLVGVPGYSDLDFAFQLDRRSAAEYVERLRRAGLRADLRAVRRAPVFGDGQGAVVGASPLFPTPGTMVAPGTTVTIIVRD